MAYIVKRLKEPSTLAGLGILATLFGVPPGTVELGTQAIGGVLGLLAVLLPEAKDK